MCQILYQSDDIYCLIHTYFWCIILGYKNLKFKHLANDITIDF